jgi:hypothetical protein
MVVDVHNQMELFVCRRQETFWKNLEPKQRGSQ